jgi:hypothetical protein
LTQVTAPTAHAGHANAHMTLTTNAHVLVDDREIGHAALLT